MATLAALFLSISRIDRGAVTWHVTVVFQVDILPLEVIAGQPHFVVCGNQPLVYLILLVLVSQHLHCTQLP